MPDIQTMIDAAVKNGISLVVCLVIIAIFAKILQWVFKFVDKLVTESLVSLTTAMTNLSNSIQRMNETSALSLQKISSEIKDGFDQMTRMATYQREEHEKIIEMINENAKAAENAREKITGAIVAGGCKSK